MIRRVVLVCLGGILALQTTAEPPQTCRPEGFITDGLIELDVTGWYGVQVDGLTHIYDMPAASPWHGSRATVTIRPLHGYSKTTGEYCQGRVLVTIVEHGDGFDGIYCDVNGDGFIDLRDVYTVLARMTGPAIGQEDQP